MIESLDLSDNNLTGDVPEFLARQDHLRILNLKGNNFTRPLPAELLAKSKKGSLFLSIESISEEDKSSCLEGSCRKSKGSNVVIPVTTTIGGVIMLLVALAIVWIIKQRKTKVGQQRVNNDQQVGYSNDGEFMLHDLRLIFQEYFMLKILTS
ncbi:uncharacterized protein LOC143623097 [Bidens hawaiensis]|uniref:uncharacterized protein LOC143623097 n=1 Tax=Bidens hawaiensis TaxID=980011 RepID=UPI00404B5194